MRKLLILLPLALALAACGGKHVDQTSVDLDKAFVNEAAANLDRAEANSGDVPLMTTRFVDSLKTATGDGVDAAWVNKQIDEFEADIDSYCSTCLDKLETARP